MTNNTDASPDLPHQCDWLERLSKAVAETYHLKRPQHPEAGCSHLLCALACILWVLNVFSFGNIFRVAYRARHPNEVHVAPWVIELYVLGSLAFAGALLGWCGAANLPHEWKPNAWATLVFVACCLKVLDTVVASVYYVAIRPAYSRNKPHSLVRSLVLALLGVVEVNVLFASMFLLSGGVDPSLSNATDALYFTVVTFFTVGYGDYKPVTSGSRLIVIAMMAVSVLMNAVVLARSVGLIILQSSDATPSR